MLPVSTWLPLAAVGVSFTLLGCLKLYGLLRGIEGGHDKPPRGDAASAEPRWPLTQQLCGT